LYLIPGSSASSNLAPRALLLGFRGWGLLELKLEPWADADPAGMNYAIWIKATHSLYNIVHKILVSWGASEKPLTQTYGLSKLTAVRMISSCYMLSDKWLNVRCIYQGASHHGLFLNFPALWYSYRCYKVYFKFEFLSFFFHERKWLMNSKM